MPTCAGCERRICDQYLLRVAPDLEWHAACLKCVDCGQTLDERCTCFVRAGKTYCRRDYIRSVGLRDRVSFRTAETTLKWKPKRFWLGRLRSIAISVSVSLSVWLYVFLLLYLKNHMCDIHEILRTCYLWQWLGPALTIMRYVMHFRLVLSMMSCHQIMKLMLRSSSTKHNSVRLKRGWTKAAILDCLVRGAKYCDEHVGWSMLSVYLQASFWNQ